jgi:hypothetical protein
MLETKLVLFLAVMAAIGVVIPFFALRARREAGDQVQQARERLATDGYVVEQCQNQNGRKVVRIWGELDHPVALKLRIGHRRVFLRFANKLGVGSVGMLDPRFEEAFRIHTSEPERARLIVDPEIQHKLLTLAKLDFRLGSMDSLLTPEYWVGDAKTDRKVRRLWMLRVPGKLTEGTRVDALVEAAKLLAGSVTKHCLPPGTPDLAEFQTTASEGQWI